MKKTALLFTSHLIIVVLLITGCTPKQLDIYLDAYPSKLVVASVASPMDTTNTSNQFSNDTVMLVISLTNTFNSPLNSTNALKLNVENAFATLSYSGMVDTLERASPFASVFVDTLPNPSYVDYTLFAKDDETGRQISATTRLIPLIQFDSVSLTVSKTATDTTATIYYRFNDIPNVPNWYLINYYYPKKPATSSSALTNQVASYLDKINYDFELITDQDFENQKFIKQKTFEKLKSSDTVGVSVSNISEGYFNFLTAYQKGGSYISQLTGEPISYPSNVVNGYGYFTLHFTDLRSFYLIDY